MKVKKAASLLLVGAMALGLLAGCGSSEESDDTLTSAAAAEEEVTEFTGFDETIEIDVYGLSFYGDDGLDEVIAAINEISLEEINVQINYTAMDTSTYAEQVSLMLSGGESFDLFMATAIPVVGYTTMQSLNQLMDISDYLSVYASETEEMMADYLECTSVGDEIYAVPCYRTYNSNYYIIMREDILEELDLVEEAEAIDSWSDYEAILQQVADAQDELPEDMQTNAVICNQDGDGTVLTGSGSNIGSDDFSENYGFEAISNYCYVDEDGNISNYFATDDFLATIERVYSWYNEGLVYKDAATSEDTGDTNMANGVTFSYVISSEIGVEASKRNATGYDVVTVEIHDMPIQTSQVNGWAWAVPTTSENPEAAVAFMNLMYTNAEIENLFVYGIEGRDYELNDEGEAVILDTAEYQSSDFFYGNQFLAYAPEGMGGDFREVALAALEEAEFSDYFGWSVDSDEVSNEVTAVSNVLTKYYAGLSSGTLDPSTIDTMLEEMEDAGLQEIFDCYQEQLDEWLAEQ